MNRARLLDVISEAIPLNHLGKLAAKYPGARIQSHIGGFWVTTDGDICDCAQCFREFSKEYEAITGDMLFPYFTVCPDCGNKRCPKNADHDLACTGSNEPGQPGSTY